jgi:hypothetical protein
MIDNPEDSPKPDTAAAVSFAENFFEGEIAHFMAIAPDGKPIARSFDLLQRNEMRAWIHSQQGVRNVHFAVNPLNPEIRNRKASKSDVATARWLHVDLDLPDGLERLSRYPIAPTVVLLSGFGYQGFWK